jgi:hypothetical protein
LIPLGDFVTEIPAADSACDSGQGSAVATTHLTAKHATDQRAYADADRTILCSGRRLLIHRCGRILPGRGSLRNLYRPCSMLYVLVMHYSFVLYDFLDRGRGNCNLLHWRRCWCDSNRLLPWFISGAMRFGNKACNCSSAQ